MAIEEDGGDDAMSENSNSKLGELDRHLIRHRELFLSRQIETYKIDMVRYVCCKQCVCECVCRCVCMQYVNLCVHVCNKGTPFIFPAGVNAQCHYSMS